jgi:hypothetical protein
LKATFVRVEGDVVVLLDERRKALRLPLDRLSEEDRAWANEQAAKQPPQNAPATSPPEAAAPNPPRTWTDTQGRTLKAAFVRVEGDVVVVLDERRKTLRLPLDRLSEEDRAWANEQAAGQPQPPGADQ